MRNMFEIGLIVILVVLCLHLGVQAGKAVDKTVLQAATHSNREASLQMRIHTLEGRLEKRDTEIARLRTSLEEIQDYWAPFPGDAEKAMSEMAAEALQEPTDD